MSYLDSDLLAHAHCYFGGGTAMVMRFGEWRVSSDIDFLISDWGAYRDLRQLITSEGISAIGDVTALREVRADRYGIRTLIESEAGPIKLEIIHEGRISLDLPGDADRVEGVATLGVFDMVATKLLANDDRWADRGLFSRDLIDLAMLPFDEVQWAEGKAKAVSAYGRSIDRTLELAVRSVLDEPGRLETCAESMQMGSVSEELREGIGDLVGR
ncbi:nucleotidyl transferase AbiEii/AbiGii toxin family protein [Rhodococcoides kyotonense]|uniref:nucleotidyl transferase AbiEii/AbiGii toxin family protein n=1 Tax=Rhodococcoides kyotonense TaxID=398843 RepID=UPI0011326779|nr:nucleotidyl transferase AbiEii/AbiGii toxin family protein [Rhodococcus kyotonensis]